MLLKRDIENGVGEGEFGSRREKLDKRSRFKTTVIHPSDPTTDFLAPIYRKSSAIRQVKEKEEYRQKLLESDRSILLGHGFPQGLAGNGRIIIDESFGDIFREQPNNIYIFCNADCYLTLNGLRGFATGMFISERIEAMIFNVEATAAQIKESNELFAELVRKSFDRTATEVYTCVESEYRIRGNPVVEYNLPRIRVFE